MPSPFLRCRSQELLSDWKLPKGPGGAPSDLSIKFGLCPAVGSAGGLTGYFGLG